MFSHVTFGITDFDRALGFWRPVLSDLGLQEYFVDASGCWAAWRGEEDRPLFLITRPVDDHVATPGNGTMVAFTAPDRASVIRAHATGLASGGSDEGAPGLRPHYHASYFGAYLRDTDGNKLCIVCHRPEPSDR